jgi:hypothetical protein
MKFVQKYPWTTIYLSVGLVLMAIYVFWGVKVKPLLFNPVDADVVIDLLTPLFVISLFIERAQEVFVTSWREPERKRLDIAFETTEPAKPIKTAVEKAATDEAKLALAEYETGTQRRSFLLGCGIAIIISIVGVRALQPLLTTESLAVDGWQLPFFNLLDVMLTGAVLGGGADGIHKLVSVVTEFLDKTRDVIKEQKPGK